MHIAAALKKLITILLLIILAGQTSGYFHLQIYEVSCMEETEEKAEKGGKDKHEKEYMSHNYLSKTELLTKIAFGHYYCEPSLCPVLDYVTPPPDVTL